MATAEDIVMWYAINAFVVAVAGVFAYVALARLYWIVRIVLAPFLIIVGHEKVALTYNRDKRGRVLTAGWHFRWPMERVFRYRWSWIGERQRDEKNGQAAIGFSLSESSCVSIGTEIGWIHLSGYEIPLMPIRIDPRPIEVMTADNNTVTLNMFAEFQLRSPEDAWSFVYSGDDMNPMKLFLDHLDIATREAALEMNVNTLVRAKTIDVNMSAIAERMRIDVLCVRIQSCEMSEEVVKLNSELEVAQRRRQAEADQNAYTKDAELAAHASRVEFDRMKLNAEAQHKMAAAQAEAERLAFVARTEAERAAVAADAEAARLRKILDSGVTTDYLVRQEELRAMTRAAEALGPNTHLIPAGSAGVFDWGKYFKD